VNFELSDAFPVVDVVFEEQRHVASDVSRAYTRSGSLGSRRSWSRIMFRRKVLRLDSALQAMSF
jgi:hypothetical protein